MHAFRLPIDVSIGVPIGESIGVSLAETFMALDAHFKQDESVLYCIRFLERI